MVLSLPAFSLGIEGNLTVQLHPWLVNANQFLPFRMTFRRRHIRILVDDMLEVVHHRPVRKEGECLGQMRVIIFSGILPEEFLRESLGKKFH